MQYLKNFALIHQQFIKVNADVQRTYAYLERTLVECDKMLVQQRQFNVQIEALTTRFGKLISNPRLQGALVRLFEVPCANEKPSCVCAVVNLTFLAVTQALKPKLLATPLKHVHDHRAPTLPPPTLPRRSSRMRRVCRAP